MTTEAQPQIRGLTINQRNLYTYYLAHKRKHKNTPCYVPRCSTQVSRLDQYLNALVKLEQYGLIRVDRSSSNYTGWVMLPPHNVNVMP